MYFGVVDYESILVFSGAVPAVRCIFLQAGSHVKRMPLPSGLEHFTWNNFQSNFLKSSLRNSRFANQQQANKREQSIHDYQFVIKYVITKKQYGVFAYQKAKCW